MYMQFAKVTFCKPYLAVGYVVAQNNLVKLPLNVSKIQVDFCLFIVAVIAVV